jgi:hypothetical protein
VGDFGDFSFQRLIKIGDDLASTFVIPAVARVMIAAATTDIGPFFRADCAGELMSSVKSFACKPHERDQKPNAGWEGIRVDCELSLMNPDFA